MKITGLEHFLVRAKDIEQTREFYVSQLGLREGFREPFPFPGYWLYLDDVPCVHLVATDMGDAGRQGYLAEDIAGRGSDADQMHGTGAIDHMGFHATGLAQYRKRFQESGVNFRERVVGKLTQLFVEDPNGVTIELNFVTDQESDDG
ncbi:MAG: VOC family protein [Burkholderiaceae bacterium]